MALLNLLGLFAELGLLALATFALRRGRSRIGPLAGDPVARILGLLAADLAVWNLATVLFHWTGEPAWHWLDVTFSPLTPPLVLHLVTTWVGVARRARPWLLAAYVAFGALALSSFMAWFFDWARVWIEGAVWSVVFLAGWLPIMVASLVLLWRAIGRHRDTPQAAMRARLLFAAIVLAGLLGSTELWDDLFDVPALGVLGTFIATLLIATVVLRLGLFTARERLATAVYVGLLTLVLAIVVAAIATATNGSAIATLLAAILVSGLMLVVVREVVHSASERRSRTLELASLGRFTAQMAHDLKNPLAALKGAIQYLEVALPMAHDKAASPSEGDDAAGFLTLMAGQVGRIEVILERYRRLAQTRIEPAPVAVGALASEVARAMTVGVDGVALEVVIAGVDASPWHGDRDLLASAFENIVRNALEAMPDGGRLAVSATRSGDMVALSFADSGRGIDPRYLEQVGDDFFTTRAEGSGLGLAFVRRIASAHGGGLAVTSTLGRGTTVTLTLMSQTHSREPDHASHA